MTHELEKLQRKGTKPTCPICHATVLSTNRPNLMGTTPELQKMYDRFGEEALDTEAMRRYPQTGGTHRQAFIEGARWAATPADAAVGRRHYHDGISFGEPEHILDSDDIPATPAVGGEPVAWRWRWKGKLENNPWRLVFDARGISHITAETQPLYLSSAKEA